MAFARFTAYLSAATAMALAGVHIEAMSQSRSAGPAPSVPDQVEEAYRWGDFQELERLYALYGKAGARSELTGTSRARHFWMGIDEVSDSNLRVTDHYYQQLDALTKSWARSHPQSALAQLLHAESLVTHAWAHRGTGFANTVTPAAWAEFRKYLNLAFTQLRHAEALAANDTSWNRLMLTVGRDLGWDRSRLMVVFNDGLAKNPEDDELYFSMQTTLLPRWGGDLEAVDRFVAMAVKNTRERRGLEMYAQLYAAVSYAEVKQSLFTSTRASWASMKVGFDDLLKRYPHVDHRNKYAYFACMANDQHVAREQLDLIGQKFEPMFWGDNPERNFEACKAMAGKA